MSKHVEKIIEEAQPPVQLAWKMFDFTKLNPYNRNKFSYFCLFVGLLASIYVALMHVLELTLNYNGLETVGKMRFTPCILIKVFQYAFFVFVPTSISKPFESLENFWRWDKYGSTVENRLNATCQKCYFGLKVYLAVVFANVFVMILEPYFLSEADLIFPQYDYCDMANNRVCYHLNFVASTIQLVISYVPVLLAFDVFFISFVIQAYNQFELLKFALENCKVGVDNKAAIQEIVDQHNAITSTIQEMDSWMSGLFLVKIVGYTIQMISAAYMLTINGMPPTLWDMKTYGMHFVTVALMTYMYCHGGAVIYDQSLSMAEAAYAMRWTDKGQTALRKDVVIIIQLSQKPVLFTAGYMNLNMETFVNVMQNVFSVYGLLATLAADEIMARQISKEILRN